jgi:hypothetical protein
MWAGSVPYAGTEPAQERFTPRTWSDPCSGTQPAHFKSLFDNHEVAVTGPRRQQGAHRSTSPSTGSTDEMMATASATRRPRIMCGRHWMLTNDGARMCRRYGRGPPSLAM